MQAHTEPRRRPPAPPTRVPTERDAHTQATIDDIDELLDDIDALLEDNPLEVIRTYHQRGGE